MVTSVNVATRAYLVHCQPCLPKRTTLFAVLTDGSVEVYGLQGTFTMTGLKSIGVLCEKCRHHATYDIR